MYVEVVHVMSNDVIKMKSYAAICNAKLALTGHIGENLGIFPEFALNFHRAKEAQSS